MTISNYAENKLIDTIFNSVAFSVVGDPYVSLHTADPGEAGASEVVGGSYAREQAPFDAAAAGATSNSGNIDFISMPAVTITHIGIWDALNGGNFLWGGSATVEKALALLDTYRIPTGDLDVTLN